MNKLFLTIFLVASYFLGTVTCHEKIAVERKNIVDNGGYLIRNAAFSNSEIDLVLTAIPSVNNLLSNVTLSKNEGLKNQKWGVAYYGGSTASLSPGENRNNSLTLYNSLSGLINPLHERQYIFANCYWNEEFKVQNMETKLCLCVVERDAAYIVDFAPCDNAADKIFWTFERYG